MKNNNKIDLIIYVLGIISIALLVLETPFSFFNYKKKSSNDNIIITSDIPFNYENKKLTEIKTKNKYLISDNKTCIYEIKPIIDLKTNTSKIGN